MWIDTETEIDAVMTPETLNRDATVDATVEG